MLFRPFLDYFSFVAGGGHIVLEEATAIEEHLFSWTGESRQQQNEMHLNRMK